MSHLILKDPVKAKPKNLKIAEPSKDCKAKLEKNQNLIKATSAKKINFSIKLSSTSSLSNNIINLEALLKEPYQFDIKAFFNEKIIVQTPFGGIPIEISNRLQVREQSQTNIAKISDRLNLEGGFTKKKITGEILDFIVDLRLKKGNFEKPLYGVCAKKVATLLGRERFSSFLVNLEQIRLDRVYSSIDKIKHDGVKIQGLVIYDNLKEAVPTEAFAASPAIKIGKSIFHLFTMKEKANLLNSENQSSIVIGLCIELSHLCLGVTQK